MLVLRRLSFALFALALAPAHAADAWEGAPFATPAHELLQAATAVTRERPNDIVVLLDERTFVFD